MGPVSYWIFESICQEATIVSRQTKGEGRGKRVGGTRHMTKGRRELKGGGQLPTPRIRRATAAYVGLVGSLELPIMLFLAPKRLLFEHYRPCLSRQIL